jgi:hypothetical protein
MKNKKDIHSPIKSSKKPVTKEELVKRLKSENKELADALSKHTKEMNGEIYFDEAITKLAKTLKVNEKDLREAFQENKGELVSKFSRRNTLSSGAAPLSMATGMFASLSSLFAVSSIIDPDFFNMFITAMYGGAAVLLGKGVKKVFNEKSKIDQDLKTNVLEYKKNAQLPSPK